jgi:hypothetical protein
MFSDQNRSGNSHQTDSIKRRKSSEGKRFAIGYQSSTSPNPHPSEAGKLSTREKVERLTNLSLRPFRGFAYQGTKIFV